MWLKPRHNYQPILSKVSIRNSQHASTTLETKWVVLANSGKYT